MALVLALCGWFFCGCFTSAPAIFVARAELSAIERGESSHAGKSLAQAAFWIGMVNVGLYALLLTGYGLLLLLGVVTTGLLRP